MRSSVFVFFLQIFVCNFFSFLRGFYIFLQVFICKIFVQVCFSKWFDIYISDVFGFFQKCFVLFLMGFGFSFKGVCLFFSKFFFFKGVCFSFFKEV